MTYRKFANHSLSPWKKNKFDPNKKARGFVGHIRWTLHGKRKPRPFRGHMAYCMEPEHKLIILKRRLPHTGIFYGAGHLWPRPTYQYRYWRGYQSIWMPETKINHKKV